VSPGPKVLVVTSAGAPPPVVTPVLAALEAHGLVVRAIDVGRVGSRSAGGAWKVVKAIVGELADRRLARELADHPPDVTVAFDPGSASVLSAARDAAEAPAPVVAVVPELEPRGDEWAVSAADRYLTVDDAAAVALADGGVDGARVLAVGPFCPLLYAQAGREARASVRGRFKLPAGGPIVLVEVAGLGYETTSQLALQLSLSSAKAAYLFAAGDDADAATALRRQVPTLGLKAKLFGNTSDAPLFWRAADVVIARPRAQAVAKAMAVGARMVALAPEDGAGKALAESLEARKLGVGAQGPLFVSSALEAVLAAAPPPTMEGEDGSGNAADVVWVVGRARREIADEVRAAERAETKARVHAATRAVNAAERQTAAAGDLEDLGGGDAGGDDDGPAAAAAPPDRAEIERLRRDVEARMARVQRSIADAQQSAARWQKKAEEGRKAGSEAAAREGERNADLERARMHAALAEMAELTSEREALEKAAAAAPPPRAAGESAARPPRAGQTGPARASSGGDRSVDDLLRDMKRQGGADGGDGRGGGGSAGGGTGAKAARPPSTVDDELEALKRKMSTKKRGKP
jgi:UDP-N-acetylglucosamine:LPS N-acetylglucosamine transferase